MAEVFLQHVWRAGQRHCRYSPLRAVLAVSLFCGVYSVAGFAQAVPSQLITPVAASSSISMPATPEQMPPPEPAIVYENGLLTITAANSTLGDILREICTKTEAEIDIPSQAEDRVVVRVGPGPARDVIASLLAGSQFNYVLVGSESDSKALTRVLLFLRPPPEHPVQVLATARAGQQERLASADETTAEVTQQVADPSDPAALMRPQQQMLQQHRQMVMEQFQQNAQSR